MLTSLLALCEQELKAADERFVKDLRKQEEQLQLMIKKSDDMIETLTKAYGEEMAHLEAGESRTHSDLCYRTNICLMIHSPVPADESVLTLALVLLTERLPAGTRHATHK